MLRIFLSVIGLLSLLPGTSPAAVHAYLGVDGSWTDYPRGSTGSDILGAGEFRGGWEGNFTDMHFESDISQVWRTKPSFITDPCRDSQRSGLFYLNERCTGRIDSHAVVDRLLLKGTMGRVDFSLGRQPVNLATTYYFSANDFFAPFSEAAFFRQYRPGVDALRLDYGPGPLRQMSLISVLSYEEQERPGGWSRSPDFRRSSCLLRWLDNRMGFESVLIGGRVGDVLVVGLSGAGEIANWLGVRGEGHYGRDESGGGDYLAASLGLDHRYANGLDWRLEYFHNGKYPDPERFKSPVPAAKRAGRDYLAVGVGYEFTPLLSGQFFAAVNLSDASRLFSLYFLYSTGDNSELSLTASRGYGDPAAAKSGSEYGAVGESIVAGLRFYFEGGW